MLHVVLVHPQIPPNTGNIIRLCSNTGTQLHIVKPIGFYLDDKRLRRAGLDYHETESVHVYDDYESMLTETGFESLFAFTTKAQHRYAAATFQEGDALVFGSETAGLPKELLDSFDAKRKLRIPMRENSRSLNLSNSVGIVLYEALRQLNYKGMH